MPRFLRPRFVAAQLGARTGGRRSLAMLLTADDLAGDGWTVLDERSWRTGIDATEAWARRARDMSSVTGWRSFEQRDHARWLWTQIVPLASDDDAQDALRALPERMLGNLRATVKVTGSTEVDAPVVLGARARWAREDQTIDDRGSGGRALYLAWVQLGTLSAMAASGVEAGWEWDDLKRLAVHQSARILSTLGLADE